MMLWVGLSSEGHLNGTGSIGKWNFKGDNKHSDTADILTMMAKSYSDLSLLTLGYMQFNSIDDAGNSEARLQSLSTLNQERSIQTASLKRYLAAALVNIAALEGMLELLHWDSDNPVRLQRAFWLQ